MYISEDPKDARPEEDSALAFVALYMWPMKKDHATVQTYTTAIPYYRKLQMGFNPLAEMKRLHLLLNGSKRTKGPTNRKLPATVEDLKVTHDMIDVKNNIDNRILWCCILPAWHFMLRMSEYVATGNDGARDTPFTCPTSNRSATASGARGGADVNGRLCLYPGRKPTG